MDGPRTVMFCGCGTGHCSVSARSSQMDCCFGHSGGFLHVLRVCNLIIVPLDNACSNFLLPFNFFRRYSERA